MISRIVRGESQRMVPQPPSFTVAKQNSKLTAGCVVGVARWGRLCAGSEERSSYGGRLQVIGCSFLNWSLCGPRLAHDVRHRLILGPARLGACCTANEKRSACCGCNQA